MPRNFVEMAAITDAGSVRQFNEDSIVTGPDIGVAVLADGMGGHHAGEVASGIATQIIFGSLQTELAGFRSNARGHSTVQAIDKSINRANKAIFDAAQGHAAYQGMGTTLALALFYDNRAALGHIGDSRIYRLRNDALQLLTRDDSLLRDQIDLSPTPASRTIEASSPERSESRRAWLRTCARTKSFQETSMCCAPTA